jgi:hypothetical protein
LRKEKSILKEERCKKSENDNYFDIKFNYFDIKFECYKINYFGMYGLVKNMLHARPEISWKLKGETV